MAKRSLDVVSGNGNEKFGSTFRATHASGDEGLYQLRQGEDAPERCGSIKPTATK